MLYRTVLLEGDIIALAFSFLLTARQQQGQTCCCQQVEAGWASLADAMLPAPFILGQAAVLMVMDMCEVITMASAMMSCAMMVR